MQGGDQKVDSGDIDPEAGRAFRRARIYLGLSASQLAEIFGVSSARTVMRWEAGTKEVPGPAWQLMRILIKYPETRDYVGIPTQAHWSVPFNEYVDTSPTIVDDQDDGI